MSHPTSSPSGIVTAEPQDETPNYIQKYRDMIKTDLAQAVRSLHTLHHSATFQVPLDSELVLCSHAIGEFVMSFAGYPSALPPLDQVERISSSGVIDVYMGIVSDPQFLRFHPRFIVDIFFPLSFLIYVATATSSQKLTDQIISNGPSMWEHLWTHRDLLQNVAHEPEGDTLTINSSLVSLMDKYKTLCRCSSSLDDTLWSTTYLPHVYFTTWFCSFPGGRTSLKATFWKPGAQEQRHNAEILQAFGPEKILQRLHRELEDPTVLDVALHSALAQLLDFSLDIQSHLLPSQTYKPVLKALTRQTRFGKSGTFLNAECWTSAGGLITLMAVGQEFHTCFGPMITHCEFVDALANALTIDMSDNAQKADAWCDLVPHIAAFGLKCRMTRDAVDEPVYNALYSALRRVWWPTLCRLRALQQPGAAPSSRSIRAFAVWLDLGEKSGLSEEAERTRHESGAPGSLILWCSWKECMYRTKEPPSPLMKCSGCGQAFYCDNNCQTRDWKVGGHKKICKTLRVRASTRNGARVA